MLHLLKHAYANTRSVIRTMVEVLHAHTLTHKSRAGSMSDFAFIDALMPKKAEYPDKPSDSLTDYLIPQWKDQVEKQGDYFFCDFDPKSPVAIRHQLREADVCLSFRSALRRPWGLEGNYDSFPRLPGGVPPLLKAGDRGFGTAVNSIEDYARKRSAGSSRPPRRGSCRSCLSAGTR
jgi:hypothetical protein